MARYRNRLSIQLARWEASSLPRAEERHGKLFREMETQGRQHLWRRPDQILRQDMR